MVLSSGLKKLLVEMSRHAANKAYVNLPLLGGNVANLSLVRDECRHGTFVLFESKIGEPQPELMTNCS
jgi:hypothetical protein